MCFFQCKKMAKPNPHFFIASSVSEKNYFESDLIVLFRCQRFMGKYRSHERLRLNSFFSCDFGVLSSFFVNPIKTCTWIINYFYDRMNTRREFSALIQNF